MIRQSTINATAIAATVGTALWFVTSMLTGRREAWDASQYCTIAYPLAILTCALLGYRYPARPWRWVLVLFFAQFIAMCLRSGEVGNLWPLGMVLFAVLSLPGIAAAMATARRNTAYRVSTE